MVVSEYLCAGATLLVDQAFGYLSKPLVYFLRILVISAILLVQAITPGSCTEYHTRPSDLILEVINDFDTCNMFIVGFQVGSSMS